MNYFLLSDNQIRDIFDNCRNVGICGAVFAASDWQFARLGLMGTALNRFNTFIFCLLVAIGIWLLLITQLQAFRKLTEYQFGRGKLILLNTVYNLITISLLISIFVH